MGHSKDEAIFITSPLEAELAERIRLAAGSRARLIYEPDLLPPTLYQGDHNGAPEFERSQKQTERWHANLQAATILWDFPSGTSPNGDARALVPRLKWIQATSSGVGPHIQSLGLADSDVIVTTARGVHAEPLAEFVMLCMLAHAKDLPRLIEAQKAHRWERYCCRELSGATLLVVGAGQIGAQVGRCARSFGLRTLALVSRKDPARAKELNVDVVFGPEDLHHALGLADYVVLSTPHTPQTYKMMDAQAFAATKPGVVIINIARGQVVDEKALIDNLQSGHVAFAGLDVTVTEPLPPDSKLWDLPNVLISPHSASTAPSENQKITDIFCRNLSAYFDGRPDDMVNVLNKKRGY